MEGTPVRPDGYVVLVPFESHLEVVILVDELKEVAVRAVVSIVFSLL